MSVKLDADEQALLSAFESGEYESTLDDTRRVQLADAATKTFKKDKRINIRLSEHDLTALQRRAMEQGLPYQTLVSSILHKYASGTLLDITVNKK